MRRCPHLCLWKTFHFVQMFLKIQICVKCLNKKCEVKVVSIFFKSEITLKSNKLYTPHINLNVLTLRFNLLV